MNARVSRGTVLSTAAGARACGSRLGSCGTWRVAGWRRILGLGPGGLGFGTLLGPEESDPLGLVSSVPPFPGPCRDGVGWGLVGGVFDMWIVDASIWLQPVRPVGVFLVGWWVVVFCFCSGPAALVIGGWWGVSFVVFVECL